jgi:hypothetical protein
MSAFVIFNIQTTLSLVVFALLAVWYVVPRIRHLTLEAALAPLLFVHAFRYTPLTLLVPGQVSADVPHDVASSIAYGDLASAMLALLALLMLRFRVRGRIASVWVFSVVGLLDIAMAIVHGVIAHLYEYDLGFNWYILNYYVPMLIVTHVVVIWRLLRPAVPAPA